MAKYIPTGNAKTTIKVGGAKGVSIEHDDAPAPTPPPLAEPVAKAEPDGPPIPFSHVSPDLANKIQQLQLKLYKAIDDGEDPGPLTDRLSKMKRAAGLVEDVDAEPDDVATAEPPTNPKRKKGT